jgi:asparagine synthase (glutamine-hydrolysing)
LGNPPAGFMCGILGFYNRDGRLPEPDRFAAALATLRNRGPDDSGLWGDSLIRLGMRRLAIVDLSPTGHQPMISGDGRYVIVFNGEIYNHAEVRPLLKPGHHWRGSSDTETLLEAYSQWGPACLDRLNGMFAFVIWDRHERRLFAARDRMGVKPLFYQWRNGTFAFASRPTPLVHLAEAPMSIDLQALRLYLDLGYVPAPLSFYREIRKLPPAHYLTVDDRGLHCVRYWDYRHIAPDPALRERPEEELIEELDGVVRDAVRTRLMSDVPLGAFLSSGTDSSMIVAGMKAAGVQHPRTFTIGFWEHEFDEAAGAARIAQCLGVDHTHETLGIGSLLALLPAYLEAFDEPLSDSSAFATMAVARLARRHVTVALTGDGGDEIFAGYPQYRLMRRLAPLQRLGPRRRGLLAMLLRHVPAHRAKQLAGALGAEDVTSLFAYVRSLSKDFPSILSTDALAATSDLPSLFAQIAASFAMDLTEVETACRLDMRLTLSAGYLQKVDVATMAYSLEARCPLTDYRLVEWAMRLPDSYKLRGREGKYLLKRALCRHLPPNLVFQPKKGFSVPIGHWLRGPLRSWATELLHDNSLMSQLPLEQPEILQLFDLHLTGKRNAAPLLWTVLMLLCFASRGGAASSLPLAQQQRAA